MTAGRRVTTAGHIPTLQENMEPQDLEVIPKYSNLLMENQLIVKNRDLLII
jgi:hypothetical protein